MKKSFSIILPVLIFLANQSFCQQAKTAVAVSDNKSVLPANSIAVEGFTIPATHIPVTSGVDQKATIYFLTACFCFQMPCTACKDKGIRPIIFGVKKSDLIKTVDSNNKTFTGKKLTTYYIRKDAIIQGPVMQLIDKNKLAKLSSKGIEETGAPTNGSQTNAKRTIFDALVAAFKIGWAAGTAVVEVTNVDNWLADLWIAGYGPIKKP